MAAKPFGIPCIGPNRGGVRFHGVDLLKTLARTVEVCLIVFNEFLGEHVRAMAHGGSSLAEAVSVLARPRILQRNSFRLAPALDDKP
jgi:hypothetical protein